MPAVDTDQISQQLAAGMCAFFSRRDTPVNTRLAASSSSSRAPGT